MIHTGVLVLGPGKETANTDAQVFEGLRDVGNDADTVLYKNGEPCAVFFDASVISLAHCTISLALAAASS